MMYGSQDIKMEKIENQIFFVDQGTSSGLKLTLIINHLKVKKKKKGKRKRKSCMLTKPAVKSFAMSN